MLLASGFSEAECSEILEEVLKPSTAAGKGGVSAAATTAAASAEEPLTGLLQNIGNVQSQTAISTNGANGKSDMPLQSLVITHHHHHHLSFLSQQVEAARTTAHSMSHDSIESGQESIFSVAQEQGHGAVMEAGQEAYAAPCTPMQAGQEQHRYGAPPQVLSYGAPTPPGSTSDYSVYRDRESNRGCNRGVDSDSRQLRRSLLPSSLICTLHVKWSGGASITSEQLSLQPTVIRVMHTPFLIGRSRLCDWFIADPKISASHCLIEYQPPTEGEEAEIGHFSMRDLSSFGTFVNGCRIPPKGFVIIKDRASVMLTMRHVFSLRCRAVSARESHPVQHVARVVGTLATQHETSTSFGSIGDSVDWSQESVGIPKDESIILAHAERAMNLLDKIILKSSEHNTGSERVCGEKKEDMNVSSGRRSNVHVSPLAAEPVSIKGPLRSVCLRLCRVFFSIQPF
jgi:hypothetical protein